ncbi:MAG: hypothetical protein HY508_07895, partial [Acidobacteria bacterium]|nr:hypothetical protein [Acidobacteriota bacterium]
MAIKSQEKVLLRDLALKVRDIAQCPVWREKNRLWLDKNSLRHTRPLILCSLPDQAWNELIPECSLSVQDSLFRKYEWDLKKRIYRWENLRDDEIITDKLYVPIHHKLTDWIEGRVRPYSAHPNQAARFCPSIIEHADLRKLRFPELTVDWQLSHAQYQQVQDVFGDILQVIFGEPYYAGTDGEVMGWGNSLIDILCELRGMEKLYLDLLVAPGFVHESMEFLSAGTLKYLSDMEKENLLRLNNNEFIWASNTPLGSNGLGISDELPKNNFIANHVTTEHLWGYFQAQEFVGVSPDMLEEFVLPYQVKIAGRFGLNCYGCCEANDRQWDKILKNMPHLRELSVSHASTLGIAAEKLRGDYVLSWKPHPAEMITMFDKERIRRAMRRAFDITRDCCVVVCLRDTQTLLGEPGRVAEWTR